MLTARSSFHSALKLTLLTGAVMAGQASAAPYVGLTPQDVGVMGRSRPEYDAAGMNLGGFTLLPSIKTTAVYDSNIFRQETAVDDVFFEISPAVRLRSKWGRHFLELYSGLQQYEYVTNTAQNLTDWNIGTDGRYDISRAASVSANVSYSALHELWSAPSTIGFQAAPNRYFQLHSNLGARYQPSRLAFSVNATFDKNYWQSTPLIGGGFLNNKDRNGDHYTLTGEVSYDISPGYSAFFSVAGDGRSYDQFLDRSGTHRGSHGLRYDGGLDLQITHLISGRVFAGYLQQSYPSSGTTPKTEIAGLDYGVQLDYFFSPILTFHLDGSRSVSDVTVTGVSGSDDKNVQLSADYELMRNIIVQGFAGYVRSDFKGSSRSDNYPAFGLAVRYLINRNFQAYARYNFETRTSSSSGSAYDDNRISIGLSSHI